jgi:glycogen operon protein
MRLQMQKNLLTTLMISRGIPLFPAGDECGRTQRGNNNAYCQDNEISWFDWQLNSDQKHLLSFTQQLIALRKELPVLRFAGLVHDATADESEPRVHWIGPGDRNPHWQHDQAIGLHMKGSKRALGTNRNEEDVLIFFNASAEAVRFTMPETDTFKWKLRLHTPVRRPHRGHLGTSILVPAHAMLVYSAKAKPL